MYKVKLTESEFKRIEELKKGFFNDKGELSIGYKLQDRDLASYCPKCKTKITNKEGSFTCSSFYHDSIDGEYCKQRQNED